MSYDLQPGSLVILHLVEPNEKYWGVLVRLSEAGITLRALNLSSFDDWMRAAVSGEEAGLAPATIFFPLRRVERMFLDEPLGLAESLGQIFERRVGHSVQEHLAAEAASADRDAN